MSIRKLKKILPKICRRGTSYWPDTWSEDNPLWGHCAVVSLLVQDQLGGVILKVKISGYSGVIQYHFFNRLPSGKLLDLTASQFGRNTWKLHSSPIVVRRSRLLQVAQTKKRYSLIKKRFTKLI